MITIHGKIPIPNTLLDVAETIKHENYKVNTPAKFQKHFDDSEDGQTFVKQLADLINVDPECIDWVYFSASRGAEPHTDLLDPNKFSDNTFVIPLIVPPYATLNAGKASVEIKAGQVYEFLHTETHSLDVIDFNHGCVMVMATELV